MRQKTCSKSTLLSWLFCGLALVLSVCCLSGTAVSALEINGSTSGGTNNGSVGAGGSFAVADAVGNRPFGYRFTVVNSAGDKQDDPVDVYRDGQLLHERPTVKYTKKQYSKRYNVDGFGFVTSTSTTGCYTESSIGIALPADTDEMSSTWGENKANLNPILQAIDSGLDADKVVDAGNCILVEPIYRMRFNGTWYNFTVSEMAFFTGTQFGWDTEPIATSNANTFYYISQYTNGFYPNSLHFEKTMFGLTAGDTLPINAAGPFASSRTILTNGYGAMVVYDTNAAETDEPEYKLTVNYYSNGGTAQFSGALILTQYTVSRLF